MKDSTATELKLPSQAYGLESVLKQGAQRLLAQAIEAEVDGLLSDQSSRYVEGKRAVVRNGYLPERMIQTGLGDIAVKVPKVRDRSEQGVKFNSALVPPYLKRTQTIEELIPWLYLKGISTGDMKPALEALLGEKAVGLSSNTVSRLKQQWEEDYEQWNKRDLSKQHYAYVWADGIYSNVRSDDKLCLLVMIGAAEEGHKEVLAVIDGYRESEASWYELLTQLEQQGLNTAPQLAIGDGALGFWQAVAKKWPNTRTQRCWVHKTANVLNKVPKALQPKIKDALKEIWQSKTRKEAETALNNLRERFETKYPKAMTCLKKDETALLAFYDFPAAHWQHIRTTNPIESVFATVRLRTAKCKNCGSRKTTLAMTYKLIETAQSKWQRLRGYSLLPDVIKGIVFKDGEPPKLGQTQDNSHPPIHQI